MDFDKIYTFSAIFKYCITAENIEKVFFYLLLSFPDKVFISVLKIIWERYILIDHNIFDHSRGIVLPETADIPL